jgi:hypothetical protein
VKLHGDGCWIEAHPNSFRVVPLPESASEPGKARAAITPMPISQHWIDAQRAKVKDWNVTEMSRHFACSVRDRKVRLRGLGVPENDVQANISAARDAFSVVLKEAISRTTGEITLIADVEDLKVVGAG